MGLDIWTKIIKQHNINTDSSYRFERGVDIEMVQYALKRAATLADGWLPQQSALSIDPSKLVEPIQLIQKEANFFHLVLMLEKKMK